MLAEFRHKSGAGPSARRYRGYMFVTVDPIDSVDSCCGD